MMRITVHHAPGTVEFQLEGRLTGTWVRVLEECWQENRDQNPNSVFRVNLNGVTAIDASGQACLAALHGQGAGFIAADCLMSALVAEIDGSSSVRAGEGINPNG